MSLYITLQHEQLTCEARVMGRLQSSTQRTFEAENWQPALLDLLAEYPKHQRCKLQLGAPYVQWFITQHPDKIHKRDELLAFLQYQAQQQLALTDTTSSNWQLSCTERSRPGDKLLVAAIQQTFFEPCQQLFKKAGRKLNSLSPLLLKHWPTLTQTNQTEILAFCEPAFLTLMAYQNQQCQRVRVLRLNNTSAQIQTQQFARSLVCSEEAVHLIELNHV